MIVPQFWAEARLHQRLHKRSVTVRRFGWSDESQQAAQAHADQRTREAFDRVLAGEPLRRREARIAYGGEDGVPIREQIVSRHAADTVITRNSYGALCLNSPDVLFADIDFDLPRDGCLIPGTLMFGLWLMAAAVGWWWQSWLLGIACAIALPYSVNRLLLVLHRRRHARDGGPERRALDRVRAFAASHLDWQLRLYRSPAGFRLMAVHRTFDPQEPAVAACFEALGVDPVYRRLCLTQNCFRARLTAKPWRIGIRRRIRPSYAAWSPEQAQLPERLSWIAEYEGASSDYAACRFVQAFGEAAADPRAEQVRALHDAMCRADSALPLA